MAVLTVGTEVGELTPASEGVLAARCWRTQHALDDSSSGAPEPGVCIL